MKKKLLLLFPVVAAMLHSCQSANPADNTTNVLPRTVFSKEDIKVRTTPAVYGTFDMEVISNGKAYAVNKADIKFPFNEKIVSVFVRNGDRVRAGQSLAGLDPAELNSKLARAREAVEKAMVDLDDRLIDYGYRLKDSAKVPADMMRMAKMKSGYNVAQYNYTDILNLLEKSRVTAPFPGKVANLEARQFNNADAFRKLCTLIDDEQMQVEFLVLETEYRFIEKGSIIEVIAYGDGVSLKGTVTQINPLIDENGMIRIVGAVSNPAGHLLDGMSVKVIVKKPVPGKLYIPKEAVVQRQDREVVFTYAEGRAKWNYVETDLKNSHYVSIKSGLEKGQQVIISNNLNLAHNAEVTIDKSKPAVE